MGKLGFRLASRKKAKRWAKGQSSNSNPTTTKHREQATGMFFKDIPGTPGITKEDLQKHDAMQGIESHLAKLDVDEDDQAESTVNTVDTFATSYSNCSNVSFERFLSHFQSNSIMHKEMLAILSAVTEIIKQNGGNESATEYFAALMNTLEAMDDDTSIAATVSLLGMNLKKVPKNVLNLQFGATSQILLQILSKYTVSENYLITRHCIGCLSVLLRAQEAATWIDSPVVRQALDAILLFTTHAKPKVRKSAQHGICAILKGSDLMRGEKPPSCHPAAGQIATYCTTQLSSTCEQGSSLGFTIILHTLTLLRDIMHQLPKSHVKTICERILSIMTLKNALITSCCLQTLHGLFVSRPVEATLPLQRNVDIIRALYDYQPSVNDTQPTLAWLTVMQEAYCNLMCVSASSSPSRTSPDVGPLLDYAVPKIVGNCIELWLSDKTEVISGASHTLKIIFQECVAVLCDNEEQIGRYGTTLSKIISMMHKALSYQYLHAWQQVLHLIALLFKVTEKPQLRRHQGLVDIIKSLGELRDSHNFAHNNDVEYAIGAAIRSMGPEVVLDVLPLRVNDMIYLRRGWMIPLLKDCIMGSSIAFFKNVLLPIALICERKMKEPISGKTYGFLVPQVWSILPSVCNNASDVKDSFKNIAKLLGTTISDRKDLRLPVMTALRRLITVATLNENAADVAELARFAKNYLPILFNLYTARPSGTDEEGQRLAALDTIKVYMTVTSSELANELFDRALSKLDEPNTDAFSKDSIYDLIRVLIGYTDVTKLNKCYDMCMPFLKDDTKQKEQKKAYRFLEEVSGSEKEVCKQFLQERRREIQKALTSSATSVIKTSRGARLACLMNLVKVHPQLEKTKFLKAIVPEIVLAVKDMNERCRNTAYRLLNIIAEGFLNDHEHLKDYIDMLTVGLGGDQKYVCATLFALASLTYHHNVALGTDTIREILTLACTLTKSPTREIVEPALSYVKVYVTVVPPIAVAPSLSSIVESLSQMNEDCKRHFRQRMRDIFTKLIRKYGIEPISSMIPASDIILHKRLKNMSKVENVKRKRRELEREKKVENKNDEEFDAKRRPKSIEEILADSDEEFEATENKELRKNKKKISKKDAWIQESEENIVDLADPAAAKNITTTQPGVSNPKSSVRKVKDHGFKTAPDGRLIIADDNDRDSDIEKNKSKRKASFLQNDSEDDYDDKDDVSVTTARTGGIKKAKYSESMSDVMSSKSQATSRYQAGGSGIHRPLKTRKVERVPGSEYRAIKATGDIKKKGKPDPYVYLPLTRSALNRRKKKKNAGKFQNIFSGMRKDARVGTKNKRNKR